MHGGQFSFQFLKTLLLVTGTTLAGKVFICMAEGPLGNHPLLSESFFFLYLIVIYIAEGELRCSKHGIMMWFLNAVV